MTGIQKNNISLTNPVILIAPLDWGLGHTTRCIPLIHSLLSLGCRVIAAVDEKQRTILEKEFTNLLFVPLRGYRLAYGRTGWRTVVKIIFQIPRILAAIRYENRWLQSFVHSNEVHAVVSDNRYGLFSKQLPCVFITHQLAIQVPFGSVVRRLIQAINYRFIRRFSACWVPDYQDNVQLAGKLSHPQQMPVVPVSWIGRLSRIAGPLPAGRPGALLVILSGPEPQRSILEKIIVRELERTQVQAVLVRGVPGIKEELLVDNKNILIYNYLSAPQLAAEIGKAEIIVSRSGYSTVMDLTGRGKKCVYIPTPGQAEQIYLADYLQEKRLCIRFRQTDFRLDKALQRVKEVSFASTDNVPPDVYKGVLEDFVGKLRGAM